jgi:hypothetical protein
MNGAAPRREDCRLVAEAKAHIQEKDGGQDPQLRALCPPV